MVSADGARWITDCVEKDLPNYERCVDAFHVLEWARHCRIPGFVELQKKIMRHRDHILNIICQQVGKARIEANNNKIKLIIRRSFGFRNIQTMLDMILLVCSNINITLPNRPAAYVV